MMSNTLSKQPWPWCLSQTPVLLLALLGASGAQAFNIDSGVSDLELRWDNTLRYSNAWRLKKIDDETAASSDNPNIDDGDLNYRKGRVSSAYKLPS